MKILIYTHEFPPFPGGLATTSYKLAEGFQAVGIETTVLAPTYSNEDRELDKDFNFCINRMGALSRNHGIPSPIRETSGLLSLTKYLSNNNPDVIVLITREAHVVGGIMLDPNKYKIIVRVAGYEAKRFLLGKKWLNKLQGLSLRKLYLGAHKIISPSDSTKQLLIDAKIPDSIVKVIHNGVKRELILNEVNNSELESIRKRYSIRSTEKVITTVSRLVPGKGQDKVIEALSLVRNQYDNFKYIIVGDGSYRKALIDLVQSKNLESKVVFTGPIPNERVSHYYDLCDIFIMVNRTILTKENIEGLPNVLIEAASRAKPIITGLDGGSREAVEHGRSGYVVNGEDINQISEYLLELLTNEKKSKDFGVNGRQKMLDEFTEEGMIERYLQTINALNE